MTIKEKNRFFSPPKGSYFLFGPRGTGKSTWIKQHYPKSYTIDLLLQNQYRIYSAYPERLKQLIDAQENIETVVIDEIQRIPELLSIIHALIEERKEIQFILTGSNARKLKKHGVDLLAGRAIKRMMHPFLASEMGSSFHLENALSLGMLPIVWGAKDPEEVLETYVDLYVQEEVKFEGFIRNIGSFSRFLSVIAFSHANALNLTNIARECEVKRHLVNSYLEILQDLLLVHLVPVFTNRAQRILVSHPKLYLFDTGVFRSLRKLSVMDSIEEIHGGALEGLVFQHLLAWCDYSKGKYQISYWRTKSGLEVDFIVYGGDVFLAIEVKNNTKVFTKDLRGLLHFKEDYPECKTLLLYQGEERIINKGVLCLPCEEFLKSIIPNEPLFSKI